MPIALTDEIKDHINGALLAGNPLILASVDAQNRPRLSYRGSIQVFSADQLGFWARNGEGATMASIRHNPNVSMMYRDPARRVMLQIAGRARPATPDEVQRVYDQAPEPERRSDPDRKGVGVIIDLDRIDGLLGVGEDGARRFVSMARD